MKIGITCYPTYGGSGVLASELGRLLAQRGHEIHFITSRLPYRFSSGYQDRMFFHHVHMTSYPLFEHQPYDLILAAKMKEVFFTEGLDLLHVHYAMPHAISAFLAQSMSEGKPMPFVTTLHGTDITIVGQEQGFFDITRLGINRSTMVTAVSDYLKEETEKVFKPDIPIHRIHNFVDLNLFKRGEKRCGKKQFARPEQVLFSHISNFRPVKRVQDVVRVFAKVQKEVDSVLLMVGEGPTQREARDIAVELGVNDKIRFLGNQEDVVGILACSDILLFPSELESFGLAALEAMACEVPVIGCHSGGMPEVVESGVSGFLFPVGDVEGMASAGIRLAKDPALRKQVGQEGRKRAERLYSPGPILDQYESVYRQALQLCGVPQGEGKTVTIN